MSAADLTPLFSRAGHILWRELPEEWRYRDAAPPATGPDAPIEPGDLQAFLHGMGHLLDLIRGTTEQLHADSFAEEVGFVDELGDYTRRIQPWAMSYLAELVGAELMAPDAGQRVTELNQTVRWYKAKGTLASIDAVGDVISGAETVAREGWRLVLASPRMALPPFTLPKDQIGTAGDPGAMPLGCPDFRLSDRAVLDPGGSNPLNRIRAPQRDALGALMDSPVDRFWAPRAPGGIPVFPGSYADGLPRTPDLRDPALVAQPGPHPRRTLIHLRSPDGLFAQGLRQVTLAPADLAPSAANLQRSFTPKDILALAQVAVPAGAELPDRVVVALSGPLKIAAGRSLALEGVLLTGGKVTVAPKGQLTLRRSAVDQLVVEGFGPVIGGLDQPALDASDSLIGRIEGGTGFVRLEYVTVLGGVDVTVLQASDCLLGDLSNNFLCTTAPASGPASCLRFTRATPPVVPSDATACRALFSGSNTTRAPRFAPRWICPEGGTGVLRLPVYGEVGCGVLAPDTDPAIAAGAEDDGEMGAHHHMHLSAGVTAMLRKLAGFLPLGQEVAAIYDPTLNLVPPRLIP